jgi:uncharacterized protein YggE
MTDLSEMRKQDELLRALVKAGTTDAKRVAFVADGDLSDDSSVDEQSIEDAKKAAQEYAKASNANARSRSYLKSDENAIDGVASALDWLKRKKKSALN